MAVSTPINAQEASSTSFSGTWTAFSAYSVGAESNRVLIVGVTNEHGTAARDVTNITFDGDSLTEIGEVFQGLNGYHLWGMSAPGNKSGNIAITFSANPTSAVAHVWYHSDAEQAVPSEGLATNSNAGTSETSIAVDVTTTGNDRMIIAYGGHGDAKAMAAGTGETLINTQNAGAGTCEGAASYFAQTSSGTRNMDFTFSAARRPGIIGVAIKPATVSISGTGNITIPLPTLAAVGEQPHEGTSIFQILLPSLAASGEQPHEGTAAFQVPATTLAATGEQPHEGTAALQVPATTLAATGEQPHEGTAALTINLPTIAASGVGGAVGNAVLAIALPALSATATLVGAILGFAFKPLMRMRRRGPR